MDLIINTLSGIIAELLVFYLRVSLVGSALFLMATILLFFTDIDGRVEEKAFHHRKPWIDALVDGFKWPSFVYLFIITRIESRVDHWIDVTSLDEYDGPIVYEDVYTVKDLPIIRGQMKVPLGTVLSSGVKPEDIPSIYPASSTVEYSPNHAQIIRDMKPESADLHSMREALGVDSITIIAWELEHQDFANALEEKKMERMRFFKGLSISAGKTLNSKDDRRDIASVITSLDVAEGHNENPSTETSTVYEDAVAQRIDLVDYKDSDGSLVSASVETSDAESMMGFEEWAAKNLQKVQSIGSIRIIEPLCEGDIHQSEYRGGLEVYGVPIEELNVAGNTAYKPTYEVGCRDDYTRCDDPECLYCNPPFMPVAEANPDDTLVMSEQDVVNTDPLILLDSWLMFQAHDQMMNQDMIGVADKIFDQFKDRMNFTYVGGELQDGVVVGGRKVTELVIRIFDEDGGLKGTIFPSVDDVTLFPHQSKPLEEIVDHDAVSISSVHGKATILDGELLFPAKFVLDTAYAVVNDLDRDDIDRGNADDWKEQFSKPRQGIIIVDEFSTVDKDLIAVALSRSEGKDSPLFNIIPGQITREAWSAMSFVAKPYTVVKADVHYHIPLEDIVSLQKPSEDNQASFPLICIPQEAMNEINKRNGKKVVIGGWVEGDQIVSSIPLKAATVFAPFTEDETPDYGGSEDSTVPACDRSHKEEE